jgi:L-ascorbate metabolism protein UlaG (beta-lactamase superfamily)
MKSPMTSGIAAFLIVCGGSLSAMPSQEMLQNTTGKTVIRRISMDRSMGTTFLIVSKSGTVIVLDPYTIPMDVVNPAKVDAIFITHLHGDHTDAEFQKAVMAAGGKLFAFQLGDFKVKDITVTAIAASHFGDEIRLPEPDNIIYLIQVDGLRIVHMGDIGQTVLTPEQMNALGTIDVAFMQFDNPFSEMSLYNEKGFKLLEQLNPQIVIPTHTVEETTLRLKEIYGGITVLNDVWAVSPQDLADSKKRVIDLK